jgi:hypothetical protein
MIWSSRRVFGKAIDCAVDPIAFVKHAAIRVWLRVNKEFEITRRSRACSEEGFDFRATLVLISLMVGEQAARIPLDSQWLNPYADIAN